MLVEFGSQPGSRQTSQGAFSLDPTCAGGQNKINCSSLIDTG